MNMFIRLVYLSIIIFPLQGLGQLIVKVASAKVEYRYNTFYSHGSKTVVVSDSGRCIRSTVCDTSDSLPSELAQFFPSPVRMQSRILTIQTVDSLFTIDLDSMTGTSQQMINLAFNDFGIQSKLSKIDTGTYLGKPCNIYEYLGQHLWIWNGILMKKEIEVEGLKFGEYALSIEEPYSLSVEEKSVPNFKRL